MKENYRLLITLMALAVLFIDPGSAHATPQVRVAGARHAHAPGVGRRPGRRHRFPAEAQEVDADHAIGLKPSSRSAPSASPAARDGT